ncbi:hypothetical protein ACFWN1_17375 [Streptomyces sp. NPDC058459]|uniref:hypothetical protein n=1 Tax=Streptomyces sp. NPDC058459 TaxID=3346508 RepID=UPI00365C6D19
MAFPEDPLGTQVEVQIGTTWTDVTKYAQLGNVITHTRGRTAEGQAVDPASCSLTLRSPDGLFSPVNPRSPYYGLIGRNTPVRVGVRAGASALLLPGGTTRATTPQAAPIAIAGDLDVRVEASLIDWAPAVETELCGKWLSASKGWLLTLNGGRLRLFWSPDNSASPSALSTAPLVVPASGRLAVRATLDVDNGASGRTITFYTAPSLAGPWTQIGDPVVQTGTTSVFANTAALDLGAVGTIAYADPVGRIHKAELRNGINGTVVANPDFSGLAPGTTSFTDSAGRTWSLLGGAEISNRRFRFVGEYSDWPATWSGGGNLIRVEGDGAGILQRLSQGKKALPSTLRRRIPSAIPLAYWPMEDGDAATQAASALSGGQPLRVTGFAFGGDDSPSGSGPLPVLGPLSTLDGRVPGAQSGGWHAEMVYKLATMPATEQTMFTLNLTPGTGGVAQVVCRISTAGIRIQALDGDGNVVAFFVYSDPAAIANFTGAWNRLQIFSATNGSAAYVAAAWLNVVNSAWNYARTTWTGTPGRLIGVKGQWGNSFQGMSIGHLAAWDIGGTTLPATAPGVTIYEAADDGFARETAAARLGRLSTEEALPITIAGDGLATARMGPQRPATLLEVLDQCADADAGILVEDRERAGLKYRTRTSLYNQAPVLTLPYPSRGLSGLEPVPDAKDIRNDITVTRAGGSSGRAEQVDGRMSTEDPPVGIGRYDDSVTLNLYRDDQAEPMAWWLLYLGTWDEARYPSITILLHRRPDLIPAILDLAEGDVIRITDLPSHLPPGPIDLMVQGYSEEIGVRTWKITLVCAPAGPYRVAVTDDPVLGIIDTDGSQLVTAAAATDTTLLVQTAGPEWKWETAFAALVGGEIVSVAAITPGAADAFGRTASSGWGAADSGGTWMTSGGSASDYSVASGTGRHSQASINISRWALLASPMADVDLVVSASTSVLAAGGPHYVGLVARAADVNNLYYARLAFNTDQTVTLVLQRRIAAAQTDLASATMAGVHAANTPWRMRFQVQGSTLRARAWRASDPEPASAWHVVATDTSLTAAGSIGVRSILSSANTNTLPVVAAYDDFALLNPQRFTVTRSVNGIAKPQLAGADLRLAYPARVAL